MSGYQNISDGLDAAYKNYGLQPFPLPATASRSTWADEATSHRVGQYFSAAMCGKVFYPKERRGI